MSINWGKLRLVLTLGIPVGLLYLAFRNLNLERVATALSKTKYEFLVLSVLFFLLSYLLKIFRWRTIFGKGYQLRTINLASSLFIGVMINDLLPLRGGELVRAYLIGWKEEISKATTLGTIAVERVLDGLVMLLFLGISLIFIPATQWVAQIGYFGTGLFFIALLVVISFSWQQERTYNFITKLLSFLPEKIEKTGTNYLELFGKGLSISDKSIVSMLVYSLLIWFIEAFVFFWMGVALGLGLTIYHSLLIMALANLSIVFSIAPGHVGTFDFVTIKALGLFAISKEVASIYTVAVHFVLIAPVIILGVLFIWKEGLSMESIRSGAKEWK